MLSTYVRLRILTFHSEGNQAPTICNLLREEGINVSRVGVWKFLRHYEKTGCVSRKEGSGRPTKITLAVMAMVEGKMKENDETTAYQLHKILNENGIQISIWTIFRCRRTLGWTFRGSAYCQLIRTANKVKRLEWAREHLDEAEDGFDDVIWSDESSVQLESHKRYCCRKKGLPPKNKPR